MPDVFTGWPGTTIEPYYEDGVCADLSDEPWISRINEGAIRDVTYEDKVMMLPVNVAIMGIAYNKAVFSELGLEPPKDYEDFLGICETAKQAGKIPLMGGSDYALYMASIMGATYVYAKNPDFDKKVIAGEDRLDNEEWTTLMNRACVEFIEKEYVPKEVISIDRMTLGLSEFISGGAAMMTIGGWDVETIRKIGGDEFEFGVFPFPGDNEGEAACVAANGEAFAIYSGTEHMEESKRLLEFFASDEGNGGICRAINSLSVVKDLEIDVDPTLKEMVPYLSQNPTHGFINWPTTVQNKAFELCGGAISGLYTIEEALAAAQKEWTGG